MLLLWVFFVSSVNGLINSERIHEVTNFKMDYQVQGGTPRTENNFQCTMWSVPRPDKQLWIKGFEPLGDASRAHHTTLLGCEDKYSNQTENQAWDCTSTPLCHNFQEIFTWNEYAPSTHLPDALGFKVGRHSSVKYLLVMVHYGEPLPDEEVDFTTGFRVAFTAERQKFMVGLLLMSARGFKIPPGNPSFGVDLNCLVDSPTNFTIFASQVHTHTLGYAVSGYRVDKKSLKLEELYRGNPKWPQAFFQLNHLLEIQPKDLLASMCSFDSTSRTKETYAGIHKGGDMCEMYFMYYTDPEKGKSYMQCVTRQIPVVSELYPPDVHTPLPNNEFLEDMAAGLKSEDHYTIYYDSLFPSNGINHYTTADPIVDIRKDPS